MLTTGRGIDYSTLQYCTLKFTINSVVQTLVLNPVTVSFDRRI